MSRFAKTTLTGGSRQYFRVPAIRSASKGALRRSQVDCAFSLTCGNDVSSDWNRSSSDSYRTRLNAGWLSWLSASVDGSPLFSAIQLFLRLHDLSLTGRIPS